VQTVDLVSTCAVTDSFRVHQVASLFDMDVAAKSTTHVTAQLPDPDAQWSIGVIVGPSGAGKTTVARHAFGHCLYTPSDWPSDAAVVDAFPDDLSIRDITATLTAVGFSSPPAWIRPYPALSNGERFRCDLARALLSGAEAVAYDEFTSVVDRTVAQIGSAAVAKAIRRQHTPTRRFVAVTCHYDVIDWLSPEWVLDMASGSLDWRSVQPRPPIEVEIRRTRRDIWPLFSRHHYLSPSLSTAAQCYLATWTGRPVCFIAVIPSVGRYTGHRRVTRLVTLPDYQGVGIASAVLDAVAQRYTADGLHLGITTSHPAMIAHLKASSAWRATGFKPHGTLTNRVWRQTRRGKVRPTDSRGRPVAGFRYVGGPR